MGQAFGIDSRAVRAAVGRRRRWPWALAAVVAGSAAGAVTAYVVRRADGPDATDPEQLRAVVDRPEHADAHDRRHDDVQDDAGRA